MEWDKDTVKIKGNVATYYKRWKMTEKNYKIEPERKGK